MTFREARIKCGYTQKEMADLLKIGQPAVCKIETGKQIPGLKTSIQIARILDLTMEDLWEMFCCQKD